MRLHVLSLAYPFATAGEDAVGGSEQVLAAIDAALVAEGHCSVVVAPRGSRFAGRLIESSDAGGLLEGEARDKARRTHQETFRRTAGALCPDLVHLQNLDCNDYLHLVPARVPILITLHLPPDWYPPELFHPERPSVFLQCVSLTQRAMCPPSAALIETIENGVSLERYRPGPGKHRYVLALGRICPEKGLHLALDAARLAGYPLLLGGQVFRYPEHEQYYAGEIEPRLERQASRFLGPLAWQRKRRLLASARCLLVPSLVAETSSLVAMEAIACGTPVVAFRSGALPEIVEHGRTGFLVGDEREMADAIPEAARLDVHECRRAAEERFSSARMTARYFDLYRRLAATARTARAHPAHTGNS